MGGGKGTVSAETPMPIQTTTTVGSQLDATPQTFEEGTTDKADSIDKKKLGTRGLQIPLTSTTSNTAPAESPNTGLQV